MKRTPLKRTALVRKPMPYKIQPGRGPLTTDEVVAKGKLKISFRKPPKKKAKKRPASAMTRELDGLVSRATRAQGRCVAEGYAWGGSPGKTYACAGGLECCHLKSRGHKRIRFDKLNVVPMCHAHHFFFTTHPDLWTKFIEDLYPGRWEFLNKVLLDGGKVDYDAELKFWRRQ